MEDEILLGGEGQELADPEENLSGENQEAADPGSMETVLEQNEEDNVPEVRESASDAAFAQMRRRNEEMESQLRAMQERETMLTRLMEQAFPGGNAEAQFRAQVEGKSLEQVLREDADNKKFLAMQNQNEMLIRQTAAAQAEIAMAKDLITVQKLNPDIKSLDELGPTFNELIAAGVSAESAYYAAQEKKARETRQAPAEIGALKTGAGKKDFFTREEVEQMSDKEIEENYEAIQKSAGKWR